MDNILKYVKKKLTEPTTYAGLFTMVSACTTTAVLSDPKLAFAAIGGFFLVLAKEN